MRFRRLRLFCGRPNDLRLQADTTHCLIGKVKLPATNHNHHRQKFGLYNTSKFMLALGGISAVMQASSDLPLNSNAETYIILFRQIGPPKFIRWDPKNLHHISVNVRVSRYWWFRNGARPKMTIKQCRNDQDFGFTRNKLINWIS